MLSERPRIAADTPQKPRIRRRGAHRAHANCRRHPAETANPRRGALRAPANRRRHPAKAANLRRGALRAPANHRRHPAEAANLHKDALRHRALARRPRMRHKRGYRRPPLHVMSFHCLRAAGRVLLQSVCVSRFHASFRMRLFSYMRLSARTITSSTERSSF